MHHPEHTLPETSKQFAVPSPVMTRPPRLPRFLRKGEHAQGARVPVAHPYPDVAWGARGTSKSPPGCKGPVARRPWSLKLADHHLRLTRVLRTCCEGLLAGKHGNQCLRNRVLVQKSCFSRIEDCTMVRNQVHQQLVLESFLSIPPPNFWGWPLHKTSHKHPPESQKNPPSSTPLACKCSNQGSFSSSRRPQDYEALPVLDLKRQILIELGALVVEAPLHGSCRARSPLFMGHRRWTLRYPLAIGVEIHILAQSHVVLWVYYYLRGANENQRLCMAILRALGSSGGPMHGQEPLGKCRATPAAWTSGPGTSSGSGCGRCAAAIEVDLRNWCRVA